MDKLKQMKLKHGLGAFTPSGQEIDWVCSTATGACTQQIYIWRMIWLQLCWGRSIVAACRSSYGWEPTAADGIWWQEKWSQVSQEAQQQWYKEVTVVAESSSDRRRRRPRPWQLSDHLHTGLCRNTV